MPQKGFDAGEENSDGGKKKKMTVAEHRNRARLTGFETSGESSSLQAGEENDTTAVEKIYEHYLKYNRGEVASNPVYVLLTDLQHLDDQIPRTELHKPGLPFRWDSAKSRIAGIRAAAETLESSLRNAMNAQNDNPNLREDEINAIRVDNIRLAKASIVDLRTGSGISQIVRSHPESNSEAYRRLHEILDGFAREVGIKL